MHSMKYYFLIIFSFLFFLVIGCQQKTSSESLNIDLVWFPSYDGEKAKNAATGLKWILSYLGAEVNHKNFKEATTWKDQQTLSLDLAKVGFSPTAQKVWSKLIKEFKACPSYQTLGGMDMGKFVMLTFNSSWHYYAITEVEESYQAFLEKYDFPEKDEFAILPGESGVTKGIRIFKTAKGEGIENIAHIAKEGPGKTLESFQEEEFEVFDIMPNGQPRFAIYNLKGELIPFTNPELSEGGKPAKCMWCHTSQIQPLLFAETNAKGYLPLQTFADRITQHNRILKSQKQHFFRKRASDHSHAELLYVGYEQVSPNRLKKEKEYLELLVKNDAELSTNVEYKFFNVVMDSLIHRKDISYKSKAVLQAPDDARDGSENEPNFLDGKPRTRNRK